MKKCLVCGQEKEYSEFHKKSATKDGLDTHCKGCRKEKTAVGYKRNWFQVTVRLKRSYCKKYSIPFNLTAEYLEDIWTDSCPVFGSKFEKFNKKSDRSPSLDRIEPAAGYVVGNVRYISARANRIKYDASVEELKQVVKYMEGATTIPKGSTPQAFGGGSAEPLVLG